MEGALSFYSFGVKLGVSTALAVIAGYLLIAIHGVVGALLKQAHRGLFTHNREDSYS